MAAAGRGDRDALNTLLRRHYRSLHAVCRRLAGNDADAADAAQEALLAIVRGLPGFDQRSRFATWAYRVTVNACLDELRRRSRRPVPVDDTGPISRVAPTAVDEAVAVRLDIDAALRRLPEEYRAAVVLRDLCGLDYAEIAEVLDIPAGTVRSRIARGRAGVADALGNSAPTPPRPRDTP